MRQWVVKINGTATFRGIEADDAFEAMDKAIADWVAAGHATGSIFDLFASNRHAHLSAM